MAHSNSVKNMIIKGIKELAFMWQLWFNLRHYMWPVHWTPLGVTPEHRACNMP